MGLSSRRRWLTDVTPRSLRSSAVRLGNRSLPMSFSRNAGSYCSRPSFRSHSAISIACSGGRIALKHCPYGAGCPVGSHHCSRLALFARGIAGGAPLLFARVVGRGACYLLARKLHIAGRACCVRLDRWHQIPRSTR
jgi:hypothetical protein